MNFKKHIKLISLVAAILLSLTACSSEEKSDNLFSDINLSEYKYVDISHTVQDDMPADPALKLPQIEYFSQIGNQNALYNLETISYCPHTGTHMDAPHHVLEDGVTAESVDPTVLIGTACIIRLDVDGDYEISADDIKNWEKEHGEINEGEAVLFDTNHDKIWESDPEEYITNYPHLTEESATYLAKRAFALWDARQFLPTKANPCATKFF